VGVRRQKVKFVDAAVLLEDRLDTLAHAALTGNITNLAEKFGSGVRLQVVGEDILDFLLIEKGIATVGEDDLILFLEEKVGKGSGIHAVSTSDKGYITAHIF
jgi:hypothetical protein